MATITTPVELSLTRINSNDEEKDGKFALRITDQNSKVGFLTIYITPEQFADLVSSRYVKADATILGADKIGKKHVSERRSVVCPLQAYEKSALRQWIIDNCQEDGWTVFAPLDSQQSIIRNEDGTKTLSYLVYKYIDINPVV